MIQGELEVLKDWCYEAVCGHITKTLGQELNVLQLLWNLGSP